MTSQQTHFQDAWLAQPEFSGRLQKVETNHHEAGCSLCKYTFVLGNMGRGALRSHAKGKKHELAISSTISSASLTCFFKAQAPTSSTASISDHPASASSTVPNVDPPASTSATVPTVDPMAASSSLISAQITPRGLDAFTLKSDVTKAEIISCLQYVMTPKLSMKSMATLVKMDIVKYPDSEIAKKVKLSRDKIGYSVNYGLAPHFKKNLRDVLLDCEFYVLCFDESFNKIAEKTQMDLSFRFWNSELDLVSTRYYNSIFLGSLTASDLLKGITEGISPLPAIKILQLSMDGPNVNLRVFKDLQKSVRTDPDDPYILNIGNCGLHVSNNSFKKAFVLAGWDVSIFLGATFHLLHKSPARRALYIIYSGSNLFPLQFCGIRWLENAGAAERAITMLPNLRKFIKGAEENKQKAASSYYFKIVKQALEDPFLSVKLTFFKFIADGVEPFLREFQKSEPLSPFLFNELNKLLKGLMDRFVEPNILEKHSTNVSGVDLSEKDNLIFAKNIELGLETNKPIAALAVKPKDKEVLKFRRDARRIMANFCVLMLEKSPLNYPLTKYLSSLIPSIACTNTGQNLFKSLMTVFVEKNWLSGAMGEKAIKEYRNLFSFPIVVEKCSSYSRFEQGIDSFYTGLFHLKKNECIVLPKVVKLGLIFSNGNAFVEQGFSVIKSCSKPILKKRALSPDAQFMMKFPP